MALVTNQFDMAYARIKTNLWPHVGLQIMPTCQTMPLCIIRWPRKEV